MASTDARDPFLSSDPIRTGFWSGETLEGRYHDLIDAPNRALVEYASIRLSIGEEVYITPTGKADARHRTKRRLKEREGFEIPPGQLAFLTTEEKVTVPKNAVAFISLQSKQTKFAGLINVSGFHVDPGYSGKLVFVVFTPGRAPSMRPGAMTGLLFSLPISTAPDPKDSARTKAMRASSHS